MTREEKFLLLQICREDPPTACYLIPPRKLKLFKSLNFPEQKKLKAILRYKKTYKIVPCRYNKTTREFWFSTVEIYEAFKVNKAPGIKIVYIII